MTRTRLAWAVALLGGLTLLAAIGWWWLVYQPVVLSALLSPAQALPCLVGSSDICTLAQALCKASHPFGIRHYYAAISWISFGLLSGGLLLATWRASEAKSV
jgi:hypothetical protein